MFITTIRGMTLQLSTVQNTIEMLTNNTGLTNIHRRECDGERFSTHKTADDAITQASGN